MTTSHLVGVAHGDSVQEYLDCYAQLKQMGFNYVAIGGLLRRRKNTVRYPYLHSAAFMFVVLGELRQQYPSDWLFALGCFHRSRLPGFKRLNTWADYKGWIFQYKKQDEILDPYLQTFVSNHLEHLDHHVTEQVLPLRRIARQRDNMTTRHKQLSQQLFNGRRTLRTALASLHQEILQKAPAQAVRFRTLITHGLLSATEEKLVGEALQILGKQGSDEGSRILENIHTNRALKKQTEDLGARIDHINTSLVQGIIKLKSDVTLPEETQQLSSTISGLFKKTKREHRFRQVQDKIAIQVLALL